MPFSKRSEWGNFLTLFISRGAGMLNCCWLVTVVWSDLDFTVSSLNLLLYIAKLYWYMRSLEHNIQSAMTILCNITASSQRQYYCAIQGLVTINYTYSLPILKLNGQRYRNNLTLSSESLTTQQLHPNERIYYQGTNLQLHHAFVMVIIINKFLIRNSYLNFRLWKGRHKGFPSESL